MKRQAPVHKLGISVPFVYIRTLVIDKYIDALATCRQYKWSY